MQTFYFIDIARLEGEVGDGVPQLIFRNCSIPLLFCFHKIPEHDLLKRN
jgi:hypothetical protein